MIRSTSLSSKSDSRIGQQGRVAVIGGSEESARVYVEFEVEYFTDKTQLHWRPVFLSECFSITRQVHLVFPTKTFN